MSRLVSILLSAALFFSGCVVHAAALPEEEPAAPAAVL